MGFHVDSWASRQVTAAAVSLGTDQTGGTSRGCRCHIGGVATLNGDGDVSCGHNRKSLARASNALDKEILTERKMFRITLVLFFPVAFVVVKQEMLAEDELLLFRVCVLRTVLGLVEQNLLVVDGAVKDGFVEIIVEGLRVLDKGVLKFLVVAK